MTANSEATPLTEAGRTRTAASAKTIRRAAFAVAGLAAVACMVVVAITRTGAPTELLSGLTQAQNDALVAQHNAFRCLHGAPPMTYDATMASTAQNWADQLKTFKNCQMIHNKCDANANMGLSMTEPCPWGENIAAGPSPAFFDQFPSKAVDAWYDEISNYKVDGPNRKIVDDPAMHVGHFTQVVWKDSTKMGCGAAQCGASSIIVCHYMNPGNSQINGQPDAWPINVLPVDSTKTEASCGVVPHPPLVCPTVSSCDQVKDKCFFGWTCGGSSYTCGDPTAGTPKGCTGVVDVSTAPVCTVTQSGSGCTASIKGCNGLAATWRCTSSRGGGAFTPDSNDYTLAQGRCTACAITIDGKTVTM